MGIIILLSIFIIAVVMTVKEIKEGMTAPEVAQTIKDNFDALNTEKETVGNVGKVKESVDNANKNTGVSNYPAFSATEDVAVGVVRNYNGLLYRSIVAGANEWNEANWERVSLESLQNEKLTELARYESNPEYARAYTDADGRFLWGIKHDGSIYYGAGVPQQVIDYINEKIAELSLDEYEDIVAFLADLEKGDETLQDLLDKKVDGEYVENPEFVNVKTDAEDKILEATEKDGTKVFGGNVKVLGSINISGVNYKVVTNPEWLEVVLDAEGRIICGIRTDGTFCIVNIKFLDSANEIKDKLSFFDTADSPEFISVEVDADGKILGGRKTDGTKFENVGFATPKVSIDGTTVENIEDPEGRHEITLDSEQKVISYRKEDGTIVENIGIETKRLEANDAEIDELSVKTLTVTEKIQLTTETDIYVERPKFAELYFDGEFPTDASEIRTQTTPTLEFRVNGMPLFKANTELSIQGHGSIFFTKKGYTLDLKNNVWNDEDQEYGELSVKFGDMISVDSFHLKAYYTDRTHARAIGSARMWRDMIKCLPYPYNKVNNKPIDVSDGQKTDAIFISDAKYSEDGFPCAVYLNGDFYGLYSLKLKKSRQNYAMEKGNKNEIFLDSLGFEERGAEHSAKLSEPFDYVSWELKNPKLSGYEEGGVISDVTVLANINRLFNFTNNLATMFADYADYIVLPHWLCWIIFSEITSNIDTNGNNYELLTWDGTHWSIIPYDLDNTIGVVNWDRPLEITASGYKINFDIYTTLKSVYLNEIKELYTTLRNSGFIEINNLYQYYIGQTSSIPREIYKKDLKAWPNTIYEGEITTIEQIYTNLQSRIDFLDTQWLLTE